MTLRNNGQSTIYLLRHAHSAANNRGILAGQKLGISLSSKGKAQAIALIPVLEKLSLSCIHTSPLQRCLETIEPFARTHPNLSIEEDSAFIEMHYGQWSGSKLALLSRKSLWRQIQKEPSGVRFPEGESFAEMASRAIEGIEKLRGVKGNHLVISHGDVIRVIINHYLGNHLDNFQRLSIDPASLSSLSFHKERISIHTINSTQSAAPHSGSTLGGGGGEK